MRTDKDHANPYFPFFHLQGNLRGGATSFWHLQAKPGREMVLTTMKTATSARQISDNVDCAWLDEELFDLLQKPDAADALAAVLAETWFGRGLNDLDAVARKAKAISRYERRLRNPATIAPAAKEDTPAYVRDPAFRRVVTEIYDYRCAASGLRLVLDDGTPLVEAAHIHPFSEAGDDDPRNGLALTPNMHWAMDRWLIAPDTEFRWRVSRVLDKRVPDHRMLAELEGKKLFLPREARMYPKREAIEWRLERLAP